MLVSGGKILALGKVFGNESLAGSGTPDNPLGVNAEWLQDYIASAGDTIPYSGVEPIRIDDHRVSFNSAGFASESWVQEQKYAPSAWVDEHYAKKTDLDPYVLKSFLEDNYYDKNTIDDRLSKLGGYKVVNGKPDTHEPDYEGDDKEKYIFLTQDPAATGLDVYFEWIWLEDSWKCIGETSMDLDGYATKTWVNEQGFLKEDALQPYATTEWVNANFSGKDALDEEFAKYYTKNETSAASAIDAEFAKYQPSGDYITSEEAAATYIQKTWSADKDFTPYSGSDGIKVEDHVILLQESAFNPYASKQWVEEQDYLQEEDLQPYAKTEDVNVKSYETSAWALDTFFKTSEYFYAVSGTDSSSEYFNWTEDTLSASWKVKHFNLSFNYAVKPVSASPDFIYARMQVGNTTIDDRHYVEGYSDTVSYNVSFNIYNADDKTYKFTFSAENDKLSIENLQISCIGFINPRTLSGNLGFAEDGTYGNFVDSDGNNLIFVEKLPVG